MNNTRARFEEIWPVPECAEWSDYFGKYLQAPNTWATIGAVSAYNARLDTFTRCQETTSMYVGLIEELVDELEKAQDWIVNDTQSATVSILLTGAKQIMEQKK